MFDALRDHLCGRQSELGCEERLSGWLSLSVLGCRNGVAVVVRVGLLEPLMAEVPGQVAALAALKDTEHLRRSRELNASEMTRVTPQLEALGLGVTPSQANFLLVDFHRDAGEVFQKLMKLGVIVRPMGGYGLTTCARITLGTESQNDTLLRVLPEALS